MVKCDILDSKCPSAVRMGVFWDTPRGILCLYQGKRSEVFSMFSPKGYYTAQGYTGFLPDGSRMCFPTQDEYLEYVEESRAAA